MNNKFNKKIKYTKEEWETSQDKEHAEIVGGITQIIVKAITGVIIFSIFLWLEGKLFHWINLDIDSLVISYKPLLFSSETIPLRLYSDNRYRYLSCQKNY